MNECTYKNYDELPLMLNVVQVAAVLGIYGDLFASVVKRQCGIKDYGTIFPGHASWCRRTSCGSGSTPTRLKNDHAVTKE